MLGVAGTVYDHVCDSTSDPQCRSLVDALVVRKVDYGSSVIAHTHFTCNPTSLAAFWRERKTFLFLSRLFTDFVSATISPAMHADEIHYTNVTATLLTLQQFVQRH